MKLPPMQLGRANLLQCMSLELGPQEKRQARTLSCSWG
jgi:hypothetical protein